MSPTIDAGSNALVPDGLASEPLSREDPCGTPRLLQRLPAVVDMGADELISPATPSCPPPVQKSPPPRPRVGPLHQPQAHLHRRVAEAELLEHRRPGLLRDIFVITKSRFTASRSSPPCRHATGIRQARTGAVLPGRRRHRDVTVKLNSTGRTCCAISTRSRPSCWPTRHRPRALRLSSCSMACASASPRSTSGDTRSIQSITEPRPLLGGGVGFSTSKHARLL